MHHHALASSDASFLYEPPAWAQASFEPSIAAGMALSAESVAAEDGPDLPFAGDRHPTRDEIWTGRISVAIVLFALLWFGGHVVVALAGRM
nr:hypothetical protein [uncultured Sphingomonas sp.]